MKKTIKILILGLFVSSSFSQSKAQVSGFGSGASGADPGWTSGIHYMDDIRAEVTLISGCGVNATIDLGTSYGSFTVGDLAILIQMKGGTVGTHQNVIFLNNTCTGGYEIQAVSGTWNSYSSGGSNILQLIKINDYSNFILDGEVVTCHPYDGHTGGILAMIVNGTLSISGGMITTSGKGYRGIDAGYTFAAGGAGASAASSWSTGSSSAPGTANFNASGSSCTTTTIPSGFLGDGSGAPNNSGGTSANSGTQMSFGGSSFKSLLVMGDPGYWVSGYGGGKGAGGGGYGGDGGSTAAPCTTNITGTVGVIGHDGGPGGAAGRGGTGGGAIVIKAGSVNITTSNVVFTASGENGLHGGNGSNGGTGGSGGAGGEGCCTLGMDAGPGANGDVGEGGKGGDAGNGGEPGYIWIATQGSYTPSTGRGANFSVLGGKAGKKGNGGWGSYNSTASRVEMRNRCTGNDCTPSTTCLYACDVDKAMCLLAANATSATLASGIITFNSGSVMLGKYFSSTRMLAVYDGTCPDVYIAYWNDGYPKAPYDMFKHFISSGTTYTTYLGQLDLTVARTSSGCSSPGSPVHIYFKDVTGNIDVLSYHHESLDQPAYIEEQDEPNGNRCYTDDCIAETAPSNGTAFVQNTDGNDGTDGTNGVGPSQSYNVGDNAIIDESVLWKRSPAGGIDDKVIKGGLTVKMYPNPASKEVWIEMDAVTSELLTVTIYDMNGKNIVVQYEKLQPGTNTFHISSKNLSQGIYSVELKTDNASRRLSLNIE